MPVYELQTPDGRKFHVDAPSVQIAAESLDQHVNGQQKSADDKTAGGKKPFTWRDTWPVRLAENAWDAFKLPGDALAGKVVPDSDEEIERAFNLASLASPATPGTRAGVGAFGVPVTAKAAPAAASASASKALTVPARILDVTLSEGQASRNLSAIQREQAALRGRSGPPAQRAAQEFADQQKEEVAAARDKIARSLDPFGAKVAETPQEAGDLVSQAVQRAAASRKASVDAAYREARAYPGEIRAQPFETMAHDIKTDLSAGDEPVIVDSKLTPFASRMIDDLDQRISQLKIENRASSPTTVVPASEDVKISGISLRGVDQMRKRLSAMRRDAFSSGNGADARAARAVLDAFDDRIDAAIKNGHFEGDQRAVKAWDAARASYADYRKTFTAGKNDPFGRVVEKIIGKNGNDPAIPNDVADYMLGAAGTNPGSLNVGVVKRIRTILGDRSPEWSAVKQALFSRLVEAGPGMTEFGAGKVAQQLNRFMGSDGKEMASLLFSPAERDLLQKYSGLMRQLEVPQAGANWSNTDTFRAEGYKPSMAARALNVIGGKVGTIVGGVLGYIAAPGLAGELGGAAVSKIAGWSAQAMEARQIARQMPVLSKATNSFKAAATAAEKAPTPRNVGRLRMAAQNLSKNLATIGITMPPNEILRSMQGPTQAPADEKQR